MMFAYTMAEEKWGVIIMNTKTILTGLVGGALLLYAFQAKAEITWTFSGSTNESSSVGNTIAKTSDGVTATAQAWSNTNDGTTGSLGANGYTGSCTSTAGTGCTVNNGELAAIDLYTLETAYLNVYGGGLGVKNQDASTSGRNGDYQDGSNPEHSTDNNQRYDSVLFSFSSAIDLNSVSIGWYSGDSDISVLRYTGASAPVMSGKTYAELLTSGWSLVSQVSTTVNTVAKTAVTTLAGTEGSSYWLIGAANALLGTSMDSSKDYVKIAGLAGTKYSPPCTPGTTGCGGNNNGVPEPGTLLLMGAGLFGLTRYNRRRLLVRAA